jgi:predicted lipoprotein with Yx(FWY)xxD motif
MHNRSLGTTILVDQTGMTVYHLTAEKGRKLVCTGSCVKFWPPLVLKLGAKPQAGPGVSKLKLGTIRRPNGRLQVTYNGFPLYRFSGDLKPGQVNGEGIEKVWFALNPAGKIVKPASASSGYGRG